MEETTVTNMENLGTAIEGALTTTSTIMESAIELAVGNPLIMIFVGASFVGVAIGLLRKLKKVGH